eukprot:358286-Chlamydomonas_euryale.AAC.5
MRCSGLQRVPAASIARRRPWLWRLPAHPRLHEVHKLKGVYVCRCNRGRVWRASPRQQPPFNRLGGEK